MKRLAVLVAGAAVAAEQAAEGIKGQAIPASLLDNIPGIDNIPQIRTALAPFLADSPAGQENLAQGQARMADAIVAMAAWPNLFAKNVNVPMRAWAQAREASGFAWPPPLIRGFQQIQPLPSLEDLQNNPMLAFFQQLPDVPALGPFNPANMSLEDVQQALAPIIAALPANQSVAIPTIGKVSIADPPVNYEVHAPDLQWAGAFNPQALLPPDLVVALPIKIEPIEGETGKLDNILIPTDAAPTVSLPANLPNLNTIIPGGNNAGGDAPAAADGGDGGDFGEVGRRMLEESANMQQPAGGLLPRPGAALQPIFQFVKSPFGDNAPEPPVFARARNLVNTFILVPASQLVGVPQPQQQQ